MRWGDPPGGSEADPGSTVPGDQVYYHVQPHEVTMAGEKILIVEDDGILAAQLEDTLTRLGYAVLGPAATGEDALDLAKAHDPDLILMDINLAGVMDGITAAEQIESFSEVPLIYLTGYSQEALLEKAKVTAPYGYLVKPASERELTATIETALYRHALDERLKASEERLALAFKAAQEGVWDWNIETNEVFYSPRWKTMLGYEEDEIEPNAGAWERLLHPEDRARVREVVDAVLRGERDYEMEFRLRHKDGHYVNILSRGFPVRRQPAGPIVRIVGTHFDLTERRLMEEELRENKSRLEAVFAAIPDAIIECDADGKPVRVNQAALRTANIDATKLTRDRIANMVKLRNLDGSAVEADDLPTSRALRGETVVGQPYRVETPDGGERVISTHAVPLYKDGKVNGAVALWHDITERGRMEEELRASRDEARAEGQGEDKRAEASGGAARTGPQRHHRCRHGEQDHFLEPRRRRGVRLDER